MVHEDVIGNGGTLFRSSRPDFIETDTDLNGLVEHALYCSGLPGRTSLRLQQSTALRIRLQEIVPVFQAGLH